MDVILSRNIFHLLTENDSVSFSLSLKLHTLFRESIMSPNSSSRLSHSFKSHFSSLMESKTPLVSFICIFSANQDGFNDSGNISSPLTGRRIINRETRI